MLTEAAMGMDVKSPVVVQAQNKNTPINTLTVDYQRYTVDKTVFVHNFDRAVSSSRCCDAKTVHQCCNNSSLSLSSSSLSPQQQQQQQNNCDHIFQIVPQNQDPPTTIYHGKRYLDPVIPERYCIFFNNSFKAAAESTRLAFQSSVYSTRIMPEIEEIGSDDSCCTSDIETQKRRHSSEDHNQLIFPKIRVRISDEHGQRIRTSYDSSSGCEDNNSSELDRLSPNELWSSLEYDISEGMIVSTDGWTIIHPAVQKQQTKMRSKKCCQKCGHHTTSSCDSIASNSSSNSSCSSDPSASES